MAVSHQTRACGPACGRSTLKTGRRAVHTSHCPWAACTTFILRIALISCRSRSFTGSPPPRRSPSSSRGSCPSSSPRDSASPCLLLYDLYGRGCSDAPRAAVYDSALYDTALYVTQLALLLQHVRWEKTRVVGFSMGGAIEAAFVATFPDLVDQDVVLIASAGAREEPRGERHDAASAEGTRIRTAVRGPDPGARVPGYRRAVMSSLHEGLVMLRAGLGPGLSGLGLEISRARAQARRSPGKPEARA
ncbi:hypothetical protein GGX14DRAFT_595893 [Mycena pura]|uniref:AB hydrolase-1 domain-containing protein n=1 Tax=Mycena pura TaxID=153505 RepID=A0AAD6UX93_9AGAR|nr:hypothetical protein GGX14DRAFT_595893 [Mycena pura]